MNFKKLKGKAVIGLVLIVFTVVLTILLTVANVGLDPSKWNFSKWIGDTGITTGLSIVGMVVGEQVYENILKDKENGLFQISLRDYNETRKLPDVDNNTNYFGQYLEKRYKAELYNRQITYLQAVQIKQPEKIMLLDIEDIKQLNHPFSKKFKDGKTVNFCSYTKGQIKDIKYVLKGKVSVRKISKNFYLNANSYRESSSSYGESEYLIKERKRTVTFMRLFKIVSAIAISMFWAMLTVNDFMKADDMQARTNLVVRIFSIFSGFYAGCFTSSKTNSIDVDTLRNKRQVLKEFELDLNTNMASYKTIDEELEAQIAVDEYKEQKSKQDAIDSIAKTPLRVVDNNAIEINMGGTE